MSALVTKRIAKRIPLRVFALALVVASCGGGTRTKHVTTAPDPVGRSYSDYLHQGDAPESPAETLGQATLDNDDAMSVHFIDVGQGAATLVEFPCGAILIDTGGERNALFDSEPQLIRYLQDFFKRRRDLNNTLDALVISHPHIDHTRSIAAVLRNFRVRNIIDNGDVQDDLGGKPQIQMHDWLYRKNKEIAERNQANTRKGEQGREVPIGHQDISSEDVGDKGLTNAIIDPISACPASEVDPEIRALWGMRLGHGEKGQNANNDSVVLRIDYGASSALLAGDVELLSIARMSSLYQGHLELLDVDIYQVPHHGSRNSTGAAWVSYVTPKVAVISMGPFARHLQTWPEFTARSFGHPNINSVSHLLDEQYGVSARRAKPIKAMVGKRGAWKTTPSEFISQVVSRALYATGWDGNVVVKAHANGTIQISTSGRPDGESEASESSQANSNGL